MKSLALGSVMLTAALLVSSGGEKTATAVKAAATEPGVIVYGKGTSLWSEPAAGGGTAVEIAKLGFAAKRLRRIVANQDGTVLLAVTDENAYWVAPASVGADVEVVTHVCRGKTSMTVDGMAVLCHQVDGTITVETMGEGGEKTTTRAKGTMAALAGNNKSFVVVANDNGIEAIPVAKKGKKRLLGVLAPESNLLVAPSGKAAVAVFSDGEGTALYSFVFDGTGVRRKLVTDERPVAWSRDSKWVIVTAAARGCVVRAIGGQYRCFDGYQALGLSANQDEVLLAKGKSDSLTIYRADLGGAHSSTPLELVKDVAGAAAWLP